MRSLLLFAIVIICFHPHNILAGQSFSPLRGDTSEVNRLNRLSQNHRYTNFDSLNYYADKAFELADAIDYIPGKVEATRLKVSQMIATSQYKEAIKLLFDQKLELDDSVYLRERAIMDSYLGTAYGISGNYRASLPYLLESAELLRKFDEKSHLLQNLSNTGVCYIRLERFKEALAIYQEIERDYIPNKGLRTVLAINFGYSYYGLGEYDKAKEVLNGLLSLSEEEIDPRGYGFANFKMGEIFMSEDSIGKAITSFEGSIKVFESLDNKIDIVEPLNGLAQLYHNQGNYELAHDFANKALEFATEQGVLQYQALALETRYEIYKSEGKPGQALKMHEELKQVGDSLHMTQQNQEVGRLTAQFQFNQQKNALLLAQKEEQVTSQKITTAIAILLVLSIVLLIMFYRQRKRKEALAKKTEELNTKLEMEVEKRTAELKSALEDMETFAHSASHDLKSPLRSISILAELIYTDEQDHISPDSKKKLQMMRKRVALMIDLIDGIKNYSQVNHQIEKVEKVNIPSIVKREAEMLTLNEEVTIQNDCLQLEIMGNQVLTTIIFRNLLSNAVNHNDKEKKLIRVSCEMTEDEPTFKIEDNGPGVPPDKRDRIFKLFETLSAKSNSGVSGLGLSIVKKILDKLDCRIWITDSSLGGTCVNFTLPKQKAQSEVES